MKAGETVYHQGKTYVARPNLIQILFKSPSCEGCSVNSKPSAKCCPISGVGGGLFLCGNPDAPTDEQVIFVEKV